MGLTRTVAAELRRAGLGPSITRIRSAIDRLLPMSVYSAGPMRLAARTVSHREYVREIRAGRDSYIFELIRRSLSPGDEAVDIGAYVGAMTITAAREVGPTGRIYSFEPDPRNFKVLRRSLQASGVAGWVTPFNLALAQNRGRARLYKWNRDDSQNSLVPNPEAEVREVEAAPFDALIPDRNVKLVKIDVEGAELEVLAGMTRWLDTSPTETVLILESNPKALAASGASVDELIEFLRSRGFTPFLIDERHRMLSPTYLDYLRERVTNLYCTMAHVKQPPSQGRSENAAS